MKKRLFALALALMMVVTMLPGCSGKTAAVKAADKLIEAIDEILA